MKLLYTALLLTFSTTSLAFMGGNMQGMDMQQMAAKMEEMKACMNKVDQNAVESMQKRGQTMADEVAALCKSGDRSGAQSKAMDFVKEVRGSKELAQIRDCGKIVGMQPTMPNEFIVYQNRDFENRHVCDN